LSGGISGTWEFDWGERPGVAFVGSIRNGTVNGKQAKTAEESFSGRH
jgi:hypothetical protein